MKRTSVITIILSTLVTGVVAQDSILNRNVTVERDFQPIVQSAGKINQQPAVLESTFQPVKFQYSDYTNSLSPSFNVSSLLSQPTRFSQPQPFHGWIRGDFGHVRTDFDFGYRVDDGKKSILDITAHHKAYWGRKTNEESFLAFDFKHVFSTCELYFGLKGANEFYTRYGRYYNDSVKGGLTIDRYGDFDKVREPDEHHIGDKQSAWMVDAYLGIRSNSKSSVKYKVEAAYSVYDLPKIVAEHKIELQANVDWASNGHHVGGNVGYRTFLFGIDSSILADTMYNARHNIRIEPYYAYVGKRILVHAGVNLDVNIGKGQIISSNENISFAPSPNVYVEAQLAPKWATMYVNAQGSLGTGSFRTGMKANPYLEILPGIASTHACSYTPIDAELGFRFRPQKNLLIQVHGGYALMNNRTTWVAIVDTSYTNLGQSVVSGDYSYFYSDYARWKIGAAFSYHYQDIINIHLWGDYYIWSISDMDARTNLSHLAYTEGRIYDRPDWEIGLRIDARVDEHWSLYSDNHFAGSRWALTTKGDKQLRPTIDINLGCQYEFNKSLALYLELNNIICRYNDIFYGYQTPGINGVIGVNWKF